MLYVSVVSIDMHLPQETENIRSLQDLVYDSNNTRYGRTQLYDMHSVIYQYSLNP